tara:strand:- start:758 stop:1003 length:246 start_codon:yes stop_codon:yes gene_type:complete
MPKYQVTATMYNATMYNDLHIDVEASNPTQAIEKAEAMDEGDWIEDGDYSIEDTGDLKIDAVFEYNKDGDLNDVSNDVEEW